MSFIGDAVEDVGDAIGDVFESVGDAVGDVISGVGDVLSDAVDFVGNFIEGVFENPLNAIATVLSIAFPPFAPLIQAVNTAIQGGDLGDILTSAATAWIGGELGTLAGNEVSGAILENFSDDAIMSLAANDSIAQVAKIAQRATTSGVSSAVQQVIATGSIDGTRVLNATLTGGVFAGVNELTKSIPWMVDLQKTQPALYDMMKTGMASGLSAAVTGRDVGAVLESELLNSALGSAFGYIVDQAKQTDTFKEITAYVRSSEAAKMYNTVSTTFNGLVDSAKSAFTTAKSTYDAAVNTSAQYDTLLQQTNDLIARYNADNASVDKSVIEANKVRLTELANQFNAYNSQLPSLLQVYNDAVAKVDSTLPSVMDAKEEFFVASASIFDPKFDLTAAKLANPDLAAQYTSDADFAEAWFTQMKSELASTGETYNIVGNWSDAFDQAAEQGEESLNLLADEYEDVTGEGFFSTAALSRGDISSDLYSKVSLSLVEDLGAAEAVYRKAWESWVAAGSPLSGQLFTDMQAARESYYATKDAANLGGLSITVTGGAARYKYAGAGENNPLVSLDSDQFAQLRPELQDAIRQYKPADGSSVSQQYAYMGVVNGETYVTGPDGLKYRLDVKDGAIVAIPEDPSLQVTWIDAQTLQPTTQEKATSSLSNVKKVAEASQPVATEAATMDVYEQINKTLSDAGYKGTLSEIEKLFSDNKAQLTDPAYEPSTGGTTTGGGGTYNPEQFTKSITDYASEHTYDAAEVRAQMALLGYTNPTPAEINQFVASGANVSTTGQQTNITNYVDPRQLTKEELDAIYAAQGYTPSTGTGSGTGAGAGTGAGTGDYQFVQQGANVSEQDLIKQANAYADPLAATRDEVKDYLIGAGIANPTDEQINRFIGNLSGSTEGDLRNAINVYGGVYAADQAARAAEAARAADAQRAYEQGQAAAEAARLVEAARARDAAAAAEAARLAEEARARDAAAAAEAAKQAEIARAADAARALQQAKTQAAQQKLQAAQGQILSRGAQQGAESGGVGGVAPALEPAKIQQSNAMPYSATAAEMTGEVPINKLVQEGYVIPEEFAAAMQQQQQQQPDDEYAALYGGFRAGGVIPNSNFGYDDQIIAMAEGGIAGLGSSLGSYSDGGQLLRGPGTGLSDDIPATIDKNQPARLASGEFVVPADVVSALGGGSTESGAKILYDMLDRIRHAAHGKKHQIKKVNPNKVLPK